MLLDVGKVKSALGPGQARHLQQSYDNLKQHCRVRYWSDKRRWYTVNTWVSPEGCSRAVAACHDGRHEAGEPLTLPACSHRCQFCYQRPQ